METANGRLEVGMAAEIIGGDNRGKSGTITHLYLRGVMAGLVVVDGNVVAEGVNVREDTRPEWRRRSTVKDLTRSAA